MSSTDPQPTIWKSLGPKLIATVLGVLVIFTVFALVRRIVYLIIDHGRHPLDTALLLVGIASALYLFWQVRHDGLKLTWRVGPAAILESIVVLVIFYTIDVPMLPVAAKFLTAAVVSANVALDDRLDPASAQYDQVRLWLAWDLDGSRQSAYAQYGYKPVGFKVVPTYCAGWATTRSRIGYDQLPAVVRMPLEASEVRCAQLRGDEAAVIAAIRHSASVESSTRPGAAAIAMINAYGDHVAALTMLRELKRSDLAEYMTLHPRPGSPLNKLMREAATAKRPPGQSKGSETADRPRDRGAQ